MSACENPNHDPNKCRKACQPPKHLKATTTGKGGASQSSRGGRRFHSTCGTEWHEIAIQQKRACPGCFAVCGHPKSFHNGEAKEIEACLKETVCKHCRMTGHHQTYCTALDYRCENCFKRFGIEIFHHSAMLCQWAYEKCPQFYDDPTQYKPTPATKLPAKPAAKPAAKPVAKPVITTSGQAIEATIQLLLKEMNEGDSRVQTLESEIPKLRQQLEQIQALLAEKESELQQHKGELPTKKKTLEGLQSMLASISQQVSSSS